MVKVYFQDKNKYSYIVAIFDDEQMYMDCLPILEARAKKMGQIVTETIDTQTDIDNLLIP